MPELGESVHEGTVSKWLKQVGDSVKEDEPVVEIMTDKVNTELQAPASGVLLKILIPEGENVKVFQPLGLIGAPDEAGASMPAERTAPPREEPKVVPQPVAAAPAAAPTSGRRWYTPVVRSIAKKHGLSADALERINGTGEGGRVTKRDVENYLGTSAALSAPQPSPPTPTIEPQVSVATPPAPAAPTTAEEVIVLTGMRKAIAETMTKAQAIPAVTTITDVDCSKLVAFRTANRDSFQEMYGVKLTYTPFFIKAAVDALLELPIVNASYQDDARLVIHHDVHIGVAVALGDGSQGLIVPVIRDAHKKSLIEIARDLDSIASKARENRLSLPEVQGATFSITNPGTYGALFGTPMIPPGQAGILGTYAIRETPVVVNGMIAIRPVMHLVLTYDHRIIDGMVAGRFLKSIRDRLENFDFFR
ncbi:MAG: Dihydrolipoyllysine-residue succinyltransferase component of 2-oxoglutarate dehydrogenase complex [Fimbriimonadales bacterium]|nr:Dihydrolipoyllysine-residue succinyltransferase component of 2-oxoglutarate dehydrogenase complex [Fimbriimonadales bacterium]